MSSQLSVCLLSVSCVTFNGDIEVLRLTLSSLASSCAVARDQGLFRSISLYLIDNGPDGHNFYILSTLRDEFLSEFDSIIVETGHGNLGYGKGHNLAIMEARSDYHLILNPDVILDQDNISVALRYLGSNPQVGLLAPDAFGLHGERQYIAKRQPTAVLLAARALNSKWLNQALRARLDRYEYRDLLPASQPLQIELASGCYMFCRTVALQSISGFSPKFFMYFEDFDLSLRIQDNFLIVHHPQVKIIHAGGGASRKGLLHIYYFCQSFIKFIISRRF